MFVSIVHGLCGFCKDPGSSRMFDKRMSSDYDIENICGCCVINGGLERVVSRDVLRLLYSG